MRIEIVKGIYRRRGLLGTAAVFVIGPFLLLLATVGRALITAGEWMVRKSGLGWGDE